MNNKFKILLIILLTILFVFVVWEVNLKIFLADHYLKVALKFRIKEDWSETLDNYKKVFSYQPRQPFYQQRFAMDLLWGLDFYKTKTAQIKILDIAIQQMNEISEKEQSFEVKSYLAQIYSKKASLTGDEKDFDLAKKAYENLAKISPKMAGIYNDWCQLKIYQEKWGEARQMCQKAWYLYPDLKHPQMAAQHRDQIIQEMSQVYEKLGQIYFNLENYQKAEEMYTQVLKFNPLSRPDIWKKIGDIYYMQGDLDTALQKNLHGYVLSPEYSTWPLAIGALYQEKGDLELARQYGEKALKLVPDDPKIKNFLDKLNELKYE